MYQFQKQWIHRYAKGKKIARRKKVSGAVRTIALPLAIGIGIPMVFILLIYLWIAI